MGKQPEVKVCPKCNAGYTGKHTKQECAFYQDVLPS